MLPQPLQASRHVCGSGGLIVEMRAQLVDFGSRGGKAHALVVTLLIAAAAGQDIHAKPARIGEPGVGFCRDCGGDALWHHQRRDDARNDDAEHDFLHAGGDDIERQFGRREDGKAEQRHGVAGQHEHVSARGAVDQRKIQTNPDPQRDGEAEQFGGIHEVGDQRDRPRGADQRSQHAIDRLRPCRPGQRVGGDINRRHRPIGARHIQPERNRERQHCRRERSQRKDESGMSGPE